MGGLPSTTTHTRSSSLSMLLASLPSTTPPPTSCTMSTRLSRRSSPPARLPTHGTGGTRAVSPPSRTRASVVAVLTSEPLLLSSLASSSPVEFCSTTCLSSTCSIVLSTTTSLTTRDPGELSCDGAWPQAYFDWVANNNNGYIQTETSYPYEAATRGCRQSSNGNFDGGRVTGMNNKWNTEETG